MGYNNPEVAVQMAGEKLPVSEQTITRCPFDSEATCNVNKKYTCIEAQCPVYFKATDNEICLVCGAHKRNYLDEMRRTCREEFHPDKEG